MKHRRAFFLIVLFLFSCAGKAPSVTLSEADLPAMLAKAKKTHASFASVKSRAGVSIKSPREHMFFDQVTLARRPGFLRVALLAPFGETLASVVSDGKRVMMKTNWEEVIFENAEDFSLSYLYPGLPPHLGMRDLVGFLLGGLPFAVPEENYTAHLAGGGGEVLFRFSGERRVEITVDPGRNIISRADYESSDGRMATIVFSGFRKLAAGLYFPGKLRFESSGYSLDVTYGDDLRVNSPVDLSLFRPREVE